MFFLTCLRILKPPIGVGDLRMDLIGVRAKRSCLVGVAISKIWSKIWSMVRSLNSLMDGSPSSLMDRSTDGSRDGLLNNGSMDNGSKDGSMNASGTTSISWTGFAGRTI